MTDRDEAINDVVKALTKLEKQLKRPPSVKDISEEAGHPNGTTYNYLITALQRGLIAQNDGKFMSLEVAKAYEKK